ncbi:hypothetical protein Daesc_009482 [Daldinia eschscholtzii]|uniref:Uncharacterized protein n=1 Tax=Daldinia eschscholtzii TaxID=292717 RepID=A0AAX6MAG1_9PEZI
MDGSNDKKGKYSISLRGVISSPTGTILSALGLRSDPTSKQNKEEEVEKDEGKEIENEEEKDKKKKKKKKRSSSPNDKPTGGAALVLPYIPQHAKESFLKTATSHQMRQENNIP